MQKIKVIILVSLIVTVFRISYAISVDWYGDEVFINMSSTRYDLAEGKQKLEFICKTSEENLTIFIKNVRENNKTKVLKEICSGILLGYEQNKDPKIIFTAFIDDEFFYYIEDELNRKICSTRREKVGRDEYCNDIIKKLSEISIIGLSSQSKKGNLNEKTLLSPREQRIISCIGEAIKRYDPYELRREAAKLYRTRKTKEC